LRLLPLAVVLSDSGDIWGERSVTGGGIGAGAGLAIGAVVGWPLPAPALVGAAVGAVTTPGKEFKL
jgi:osmotically inducible lipoprotein OsmB